MLIVYPIRNKPFVFPDIIFTEYKIKNKFLVISNDEEIIAMFNLKNISHVIRIKSSDEAGSMDDFKNSNYFDDIDWSMFAI